MKMASSSQPSRFFTLSLKSINGVSPSSKPNTFVSTNLKIHPFKPLKISASSINSASDDLNPKPIPIETEPESKSFNSESEGSSAKAAGSGKKEVPLALKLAMEKAKEYKRKKGGGGTVAGSSKVEEQKQVLFVWCIMGQVLGNIQDRFQGKEWKQKKLRKISDKVFDHFMTEAGKATMPFEDLYIAVLLVYNDLNKRLPGPHFDPPTKPQLKAMMEAYDLNLDGELNREEFAEFIKKMTVDTIAVVSHDLIIALVAAPAVALLTKRATEGVPVIGKTVQKLPNSVYAYLFTMLVVLIQQQRSDVE